MADCWLTFTGGPETLCVQVCMLYDSGVRVSLAEGLGEQHLTLPRCLHKEVAYILKTQLSPQEIMFLPPAGHTSHGDRPALGLLGSLFLTALTSQAPTDIS